MPTLPPPPSSPPSAPPAKPITQARNPLHGLTLEAIVTALADYYGWDGLAERIPVRCFTHEPSVGSSLKFLRKTPWAREKVEGLYLFTLRESRRARGGRSPEQAPR
ncbi:MAG: VF530 family protein [Rhodoferax sp.]|nr:VF530 family protein [Rhodoferax sp.]MDP3654729.1 VF530 family protein [Rhodoferax sp.]